MRFAVGYQLPEPGEEPFVEVVRDLRDAVAEVYFPWLDLPSGRAALATRRGYTDWTAQQRLEADLRAFRDMHLRLDLLLNANCYGRYAVSRYLENQVVSVLERLSDCVGGVEAVTTASPAVARMVKDRFPGVEVRASVNMRIGMAPAMEYVADVFDGFCVQREYNRDLAHLRRVKDWADARGKRLYLLVNSGCLNFCPGQTFHDNLVAHEAEIDETDNLRSGSPHVCWNYLRQRANWPALLRNSFIRPEDLPRYEGLFETVKLATRMHARPRTVLQAYTQGWHRGNLLDLLEPGFSPLLAPYILDNSRFPDDWFERTGACSRQCHQCAYCAEVLDRVLVSAEEAAGPASATLPEAHGP